MKHFPLVSVIPWVLMFLFICPAMGQEGLSEWEPNDRRVLADEITGFLIEGEIGNEDFDDWYVLTGQQGNQTEFTVSYVMEELALEIEIYSGETLIHSLAAQESGEIMALEVTDPCFLHIAAISGTGKYQVEIKPIDKATFCEGESEAEPNDERELADIIDQSAISGYACEGDDDWFMLEGPIEDKLTVTLTYDDNWHDIDCLVYSDETLLGVLDDTSSPDSCEIEVTGDVYLYVYAFEGEGEYLLEITY